MPVIARNDATTPLALAIDMGTSSVRALMVDRDGRTVDGSVVQRTYAPEVTVDGGSEADAAFLLELLVDCVDRVVDWLGDEASTVATVGITSFWHGLLGLDAAGDPVTPLYYWADTRSAGDAVQLRMEFDEAATLDRTGGRFHSNYWPAKLRWLARERPDQFATAACWTTIADYALARFCGLGWPVTSVSMASGTGVLDVHRMVWDQEMVGAAGISPDLLASLAPDRQGFSLTGEWAKRWPALANCPWFPGIGDGACANVGSGATGANRIALTLGTSGAMRMVLPAPAGAIWHAPTALWGYRLDRERAVLGGALSNGGNLMNWLRALLGEEPDGEAMREAAALAPDSHGLTMLPFVAGERSPGWHDHAGGVVAGLVLATGRAALLRAAMESITYRFARIYEDLRPLAITNHQIVANGGAILQSPLWLQIVADTLGHEVLALPEDDEASARGAAMMALVQAGLVSSLASLPDPVRSAVAIAPDLEHHDRYRQGIERQARLEAALYAQS